jgi:hypothetical protein
MLQYESVGERMLYPMSFYVLMTPSDYNSRKQALPFVLPVVIKEFYKIIGEMRNKYPDYTPPAKYWYFQFSACQLNKIPNAHGETPLIIQQGHITTIATLLNFDIKEANNVTIDTNTRVSIKLDNSNVMTDVNVNWDAIKNLDIISDGIFKYKFDPGLKLISATSESADISLAELSYSINGLNHHFQMKDNLIHISGKNERRKGRAFFIVDSEKVMDSHIQIKYIPTESKFQIAAYGQARLNSHSITESRGGNIVWHNLANNSSIFINDDVCVKFKIK